MPPSPVLTPDPHSTQTLTEKGKLFMQFLHVGRLHVGQDRVNPFVLHK